MTVYRLTKCAKAAIRQAMRKFIAFASIVVVGAGLTACVQVAAPDKPIVINLNISITSEVAFKIDDAVKDAIDENADIF